MKKYSVDSYNFKSHLTREQIVDRLNERTLVKKYLTMEFTDKDFIGRINSDKFEIFDNSFIPYGAACILQGTITPTSEIKLTTTLHRAFRVILIVWLVVMTSMGIVSLLSSAPLNNTLAWIILVPIMIIPFRLFLHGMYVFARNRGLEKLKKTLELTDKE